MNCFALLYPAPTLSSIQQQDRLKFSPTITAPEKKYTQDHEWIDLSPSAKIGTVGISTYAAHALDDILYVELSTLSESVSAGDIIGPLESVKSAFDIEAPVAGVVVAVNGLPEKKPSVMGTKPEDAWEEGWWITRIGLSKEEVAELEGLMGEEEYRAFVNE
jgi:glycine cleavage system H protein